jgi:hypothetical protein
MSLYAFPPRPTAPVEPPKQSDVQAILALLTALGDPAGAAARLKEWSDAAAAARAQLDKLEAVQAEVDQKSAEVQARVDSLDATLARKQAAHDQKLEADRRAFEEDQRNRLQQIAEKERAAEAVHAANTELHADLEKRLSIIKQAAL